MKLLYCICAYALIALLFVSSGQSNSTEYQTTQDAVQGFSVTTTGYETTPGPNFTSKPTDRAGNDTKGGTAGYTTGDKVNDGNNSTTFNFTAENDSKTDHSDLNRTDVWDEGGEGGNYSDLNGTDVTGQEDKNGGNPTIIKQDNETSTATPLPDSKTKASSSAGYVILILMLLLVFILCVILLYMRRVSRTYSFDLQRPAPVRTNEPIGTFEPVYLDDLDYQIHSVEASADDANGTVLSNEELKDEGENEEVKPNGLQIPESSPAEKTEVDQDQPDLAQENHTDQIHQDQSPSPVLFIEEDEDTNVNSNSPTVRSSEPFVEINLEDAQQISASSVQPFSPSIFSPAS